MARIIFKNIDSSRFLSVRCRRVSSGEDGASFQLRIEPSTDRKISESFEDDGEDIVFWFKFDNEDIYDCANAGCATNMVRTGKIDLQIILPNANFSEQTV